MPAERETAIPLDLEGALAALRTALEHGPLDASSFARVKGPLEQWCSSARRDGIAPERILIQLKQALDNIPALDRSLESANDIRERIVSFAISAYFADGARAD